MREASISAYTSTLTGYPSIHRVLHILGGYIAGFLSHEYHAYCCSFLVSLWSGNFLIRLDLVGRAKPRGRKSEPVEFRVFMLYSLVISCYIIMQIYQYIIYIYIHILIIIHNIYTYIHIQYVYIYIYVNIYCTLLYLFSAESISKILIQPFCSLRWSIQDHLPPSHQKVLVRKAAAFFFSEIFLGQNFVVVVVNHYLLF